MAFSFKDRSTGLLKPSALKTNYSTAPAPRAKVKARAKAPPAEVLSPGERRAAMSGLDDQEARWSKIALILGAIGAAVIALYFVIEHTKSHTKKGSITVAPDAMLLAGVVLVFALIGLFGLRSRKRTLVAFSIAIIGFAFTPEVPPLGFAFIMLGGWLMLRAYRIQKYGTPNAKQAAREAAARPPRRQRKAAAVAASKPVAHAPAKANKRYTPKAPPRKRVPKATE